MTKFVALCLCMLLGSSVALGVNPVPENFALADRLGTPTAFFVFETSVGKFWIRRDGFGEIGQQTRRHKFFLKGAGKDSLDRLYFLEHERDVLMFYELRNGSAYLVRFDPVKRSVKWMTSVTAHGMPVLDGGAVIIEATEISKVDGHILRQN